MRVFNEATKKVCSISRVTKCTIYIGDEYFEYGYTNLNDPLLVECLFFSKYGFKKAVLRKVKEMDDKLFFSIKSGYYIIDVNIPEEVRLEEMYLYGRGGYPYSFARYYEAFESFKIFDGKQKVVNLRDFKLAKYLPYTFGIEYETSMGYVPQDICFRDGIIPLRDGSITGLEYSTVILQGNEGLNLVWQQVESLNRYTYFNKECALHIHLGGYKVERDAIFTLYLVATFLEYSIAEYVPEYTFQTSKFKASGKDYCLPLKRFSSFEKLYEDIVDTEFCGDLYLPHPHDPERNHKWECHSR